MSLWRHADFTKVWTSYTIASVGSQITGLALPLTAVLILGASATETGLLVAATMAPSLGLGLLIGAWVDRVARRPIMIASEIGSALVIGSIPVAAATVGLTLAQLYVVAFLSGAFRVAMDLSRGALLPAIVERTQLVSANSRIQASAAAAQVGGPSLGGVLVQAFTAPVAMLFDALSFVVSAAILLTVRAREEVLPRDQSKTIWHEIVEGVRWMRGHPIVFRCVVAIALANIEWFGVQAILVVYATRELGLPPALLGISIAAIGPLSLLGATLAGPLIGRFGIGPVMIGALFFEALSRLLLPFAAGTPVQAALVLAGSQALLGICVPLWTVGSTTLTQSVTPDRLLGRVNAASRFISFGVAPPAAVLAGVLADSIGLRPTLFAAGLIAVAAFCYLLLSPVRTFMIARPASVSLG